MTHWILPDSIEDVLPRDAALLERLRRDLLDLLRTHGYQLVIPPMLEYIESLTSGSGQDLELDTFKVVDLISGRLMGVRADITPQVARIDAHVLNHSGVTRLCYAGNVLRTRSEYSSQTREPLQIGAELFGHAGVESDLEIQKLLALSLIAAGLSEIHLDFSHVGIFRTLMREYGIDASLETALSGALQLKDQNKLRDLTRNIDADCRRALLVLTELNGGLDMLQQAQQDLPKHGLIRQALEDLQRTAHNLSQKGVDISYDLADLRGYHYHSGMVFAAYTPGIFAPLALGGRYDHVGVAFGRARFATGFSLDLRSMLKTDLPRQDEHVISAPLGDDSNLVALVAQLRSAGEVVVTDFSGQHADCAELGVTRVIAKKDRQWQVVTMKEFQNLKLGDQ